MFKYLAILIITTTVSCTSTKPLVKVNNEDFKLISFDAVSKSLSFNNFEQSQLNLYGKKLISEWYNQKIKTNGIEGSLNVNVNKLETLAVKNNENYKITVYISINFEVLNNTLDTKKSFDVSASEFAEISGSFSIQDQDNLSINTIKKAISKISDELYKLI